jgi:ubiquinone/menaquinone biosynthesis C-methylase UbiE
MALIRKGRSSVQAAVALAVVLLLPTSPRAQDPVPALPSDWPYVEGPASPDGTGRFYLGREIGRVMPHTVAPWLERSSRLYEELPDRVVAEMGLAPNAVVADLGAGTGYFTFRLAERLPEGRVYAIDIQPELLDILRRRAQAWGASNVSVVQAGETDPGLSPASVDAVLMVDAYHEFSHPFEIMSAVARALRSGGRVFVVEYRAEDPRVPVMPRHRLTEAHLRREMEAVGLLWRETRTFLPTQHFLVFEKP